MFFISYAKNFFVPPAEFGVGSATPVRSLMNALQNAGGGHNTVAFVDNGFTGGDIGNIIQQLSSVVTSAGMRPVVVADETALLSVCRSTLRGSTACYGAANFHSSPTQGTGGIWNYTLHADGSLGSKTFVNQKNNDQELYILPFQHAIDSYIGQSEGLTLPNNVEEFLYTTETNAQRAANIVRLYQGTLISILAVAFFLGMVGVTYQLVGHMASERELGMSQLIEAMMPNKRRWEPQVARLISYHLAFDIIYLPGWVLSGALISGLVFPNASYAITVIFHILAGLALSSYSIFFATFFRRAQLSGITTTIVSIVLAIIAQVAIGGNGSTGAVVVLSLLFPSMLYTFFLIMMAKFQQHSNPMNLTAHVPNSDWAISGIVLWIFLIIQIIVFPILAALVERSLYGTASTDRKLYDSETSSGAHIAVKLTNFNKVYGPGRFKRLFSRKKTQQVHAAKDLNMEIVQGQIAILLGANGSGKSTTLDAIAGIHNATSGTIEVDGRGGIGLCPQKNVLWDDVTVYEHVQIFNKLKSTGAISSKAENQQLIAACDLIVKENARSKTLSGGQKRKLQLANSFTGGSAVICVDEVSSGIDPLARRKVWDILLAERGRRTILLCTHFLDEADVLSDSIYIMSKGVLKAEGSAVELKHKLGGGYRVFVNSTTWKPEPRFADTPKYIDYDQTVYQLNDSSEISQFIAGLDYDGTVPYRVQGPTVEDVFLRLADELKDDFGGAVFAKGARHERDLSEDQTSEDKSSDSLETKEIPLNLLPGLGTSLFQQVWILFSKRFIVLRHNYLPYVALLLIPIIAAGLTTRFLRNFAGLGCSPTASISVQASYALSQAANVQIVYGPPNRVSVEALTALFPNLNSNSLHPVNTLQEFTNYISTNYATVTPGGFFLGENGSPTTFAYVGNYRVNFAALVQNLVDNVLLAGGSQISTQYQSFALPWAPGAGDTLQLILYFGLAMAAYPGFFALYPTSERLRKVRALHYSNGVRSLPLWTAYVLFDFIFVLVISIVGTVLFAGLWSHWYAIGYLFVVFFLYGLTSVAFSYVVSLFVPSQLAAFAFAAGTQAVVFLIYFISYMSILTFGVTNEIDNDLLIANFTISLLMPSASLLRALLLALNEFSVTCHRFELAPYPGGITVYGGPILYLIIQFFILMTFLVWYDSGGRFTFALFKRKSTRAEKDVEYTAREEDSEVRAEVKRVETSPDYALRVMHVSKTFGTNTAVDDVSFGIKRGECFALLGPNGAGKTTTISLVRGEIRASGNDGEIFVDDVSLSQHRNAARNHLGVCPQFDAMDTMTVLGHLRFYAKARGVKDVEHNVAEVMKAVGITQYANRMALTLSGGNKRKLSLGIALMGNPSVVLLDEVSSGMDAAAKRVMWRVLAGITAGRALLITTHSMEEADALANRAGILARRMLAIGTADELRRRHGDAHYVHLVHRDAPRTADVDMERIKSWVRQNIAGAQIEERTYHGQLRFAVANHHGGLVTKAPLSSSSSSSATLEEETFSTSVVPRKGLQQGHSIHALFEVLELHKEELGIAYYSVSPTTLDQIFLNVVRKHNVEEENNHAGEGKKRGFWKRIFGGKKGEDRRSNDDNDVHRQEENERPSEEEVVEGQTERAGKVY